MITLDDFRKILDEDYEAGQEEDEGPGMLMLDGGAGYTWYVWDGDRFDLQSRRLHHKAQDCLDDLLACDNPVAVGVLRAVFGEKYE